MKIAAILNVHANPDLALDTIDSIRAWCSRDITVIVDQKGWREFEYLKHPDTHFKCGVFHGARRSPYKNFAIGMIEAYNRCPDADWYMYTEFDCLFISDSFKRDLEIAGRFGKHFACIDFQFLGFKPKHTEDHWIVKDILGTENILPFKCLGCLMFFRKDCMQWLHEKIDYFNQVLDKTKDFRGDVFPNFNDYAVEEVIYPTAASMYRNLIPQESGVYVLNKESNKYVVRFCNEPTPTEIDSDKAILHPVKSPNSPLRKHYKIYRDKILERYARHK